MPQSVVSINPSNGALSGNTTVTVVLSGFTGPITDNFTLTIGGVSVLVATWVNLTTVLAVTPAGQSLGASNVVFTDTTSAQTATLAGGFTYQNPGVTNLLNTRTVIRQRCDMVNDTFISDAEFNSYINYSYYELYDLILQKFADDYYEAKPYTYTTASGQQLYPLPLDFYKLMGVEVALNPSDPNSWVSLRKFQFIQRNLWNYPNVYTFYGVTNLRYRLNGNNLYIVPIPSAGQTLRIWYAPRLSQLINDTDTLDGVSGWEEYVIADVCIKALTKEESDASVFMAQKAELKQRIEEAAENRDVGEPEVIGDSKRRNFAWTYGDGSDGAGGGAGYG